MASYVFHPDALLEYEEAMRYYLEQASPGHSGCNCLMRGTSMTTGQTVAVDGGALLLYSVLATPRQVLRGPLR